MRLLWDERAWEQYISWQTEDKKMHQNLQFLVFCCILVPRKSGIKVVSGRELEKLEVG